MTALLVEVDGATVPLTTCSWYFVAPCGCTYGAMIAQLADERYGRDVYATEDQAWAHFAPNRIQRERDRAGGDRAVLGLTSDLTTRVVLGCTHVPRYGRETTPIPDGYCWAHTDRPRTKHLIAGEAPEKGGRSDSVQPFGEKRAALCGRSENRYWRADEWRLDDLPECLPCAARAKAWHETHVAVAPLVGAP